MLDRFNLISLLLLVSSYVFSVPTVDEQEKNTFGILLALLICFVLAMVIFETVHTFIKPPYSTAKSPSTELVEQITVQSTPKQ
jgi:hypothetical protein